RVPAFSAASTWSIAAALLASFSFWVETPSLPARSSRNAEGESGDPLPDAAIAAPPAPAAMTAAAATARPFLERSPAIGSFRRLHVRLDRNTAGSSRPV